jgi:hypothetical protein
MTKKPFKKQNKLFSEIYSFIFLNHFFISHSFPPQFFIIINFIITKQPQFYYLFTNMIPFFFSFFCSFYYLCSSSSFFPSFKQKIKLIASSIIFLQCPTYNVSTDSHSYLFHCFLSPICFLLFCYLLFNFWKKQ